MIVWVRFVGGSMHGEARPAQRWPRDGERAEVNGELYFFDPMSDRFVCRWPPHGHRPRDDEGDDAARRARVRGPV